MLNILDRYSAGVVFLIVLCLFILNSVLRIKDARKEFDDKEDLSGFSKAHLTWVLIAHSAIILWGIAIIMILLYKIFTL